MDARDPYFSTFECTSGNDLVVRGSVHGTGDPDAPCVVFCHGFTGQRLGPGYLFVKMSRAFADNGIASVRFDFSGAGESEGWFSDMNTTTMMQDLENVIGEIRRRMSPSRLILCGHSFGGMIAARLAASLGADGLILLAPVSDPEDNARRNRNLLEAGPNSTGFYEKGPHEMSISFLESLAGFNPVRELATSYKNPLLLIQGECDLSIPVAESYRYITAAENTPISTKYLLLKDADHNFSHVADVKSVIAATIAWLKEHFVE
jgi:pimeloyl-ACP methyl ester carboxylesterase